MKGQLPYRYSDIISSALVGPSLFNVCSSEGIHVVRVIELHGFVQIHFFIALISSFGDVGLSEDTPVHRFAFKFIKIFSILMMLTQIESTLMHMEL